MIRREMSLPDGDRVWALISQVEHARVAAELARRWREPLVPADERRGGPDAAVHDELLAAIAYHDDGWAEWEEAPDIDPEHGRPRSFMEMPQADSLAIWSKSIAVAEQIGPLAAWVVAGHFAALLKVGGESRSEEARLAREWNDLMQSRREAWLRDLIGRVGPVATATRRERAVPAGRNVDPAADRTQKVAEYALRVLQFFDAASLWICCTCPLEGADPADTLHDAMLAFADGTQYRFTGGDGRDGAGAPLFPTMRPWPLAVGECRLEVDCVLIPVKRYTTVDDLVRVSQPHRLIWRLRDYGAA